ncbi:hypothetical protein P0Y35_15285 [Kiritimatiellaeota bacterium B1221]|nr:hypothetical protein [Kiritimatiellaeota bacterium B1221]
MRTIAFMVCLVVPVFFLCAGETAGAKRRPRIRVYDQEANVMPVIQSVDTGAVEQNVLEKKIRGEVGAPSQGNPIDLVSPLPSMNMINRDARAEMKDEEEESWISPMDLLSEEDRIDSGDLDLEAQAQTDTEMEILDWAELQKSMIEDALEKQEPEMTEEDVEELLQGGTEDAIDSSRAGGLEMDEVAPLQELADRQGDLGEARHTDRFQDTGEFVPVLPSARQMNGEISKPVRERNAQLELSGSREMLNALKEKWAKPATPSLASRAVGGEMPGGSAITREFGMPRSGPREVSASGFSLNNPAISRQSAAPKPVLRESQPRQLPSVTQPPAQPRETRGSEYRLRSQLGVSPGL